MSIWPLQGALEPMNAQRQAHEVKLDKRIGGFAGEPKQQVYLNHGDGGSQGDQNGGAQTGLVAVDAAIQADQRSGGERQSQPQGNFRPCNIERQHMLRGQAESAFFSKLSC